MASTLLLLMMLLWEAVAASAMSAIEIKGAAYHGGRVIARSSRYLHGRMLEALVQFVERARNPVSCMPETRKE